MKKILFTLFFFSILFVSYAHVQTYKEVSTSLYCEKNLCSNYSEIYTTKLYFENEFRVSTTAMVLSPEGADKNDLPDRATICPGPVTLHSKIKSYFAQGNSWSAKMSVAVLDNNTNTYEDYSQVNRQEFEYSKTKYEKWYGTGNAPGQNNPFSNTPEPVTFSPTYGQEFKNKKGFAGGAVKAKSIFSASGTNETYFEGDKLDWTNNLGEGSYNVSSQLNVEGVTIGLTRTGGYLRTTFYSYINRNNQQFSTSIPKASILIHVVNANDISMELVSRTPSDPVPLPTDMTIIVKNTGQIPIKVTSASITQGYSITPLQGFNQEIPAGKEHTLKVRLNATAAPPSSATITLNYQSSGPTCDGNVKTKQLNFAISTSVTGPDLSPKITWHLPFPFEDGNSAEITISDCNQFMMAGAHNSTYSIKTNNGSNLIKEETVRVGQLGPGNCSQLYSGSVVCTKNILVTVCSDVKDEVKEENERNNCITETQDCSGGPGAEKNCTLLPSYAMFIPPSSKYFSLFCGIVTCTEASWKLEDLDKHVGITAESHAGATVSVDAEAPPQKGKLVADAKSYGEKYMCSSVIDIIESECEDYI